MKARLKLFSSEKLMQQECIQTFKQKLPQYQRFKFRIRRNTYIIPTHLLDVLVCC